LPDIEASLWQRFRDQGVLVYGLHPGDDSSLVADFIEQTGVTFPVLDGGDTVNRFTFPPGVAFPYPRDVVIDKRGRVRLIRNSFDPNEMTTLIEQLLAE
jgi:peroxiredoxin